MDLIDVTLIRREYKQHYEVKDGIFCCSKMQTAWETNRIHKQFRYCPFCGEQIEVVDSKTVFVDV